MPSGIVKFFNPAKGFGFIAPRDGGADIFVHISAVERSGLDELQEGDEVEYDVEQDRRTGKLAAANLSVTGRGSAPPRAAAPRFGGAPRGRDNHAPAPRARTPGDAVGAGNGTVKWFNPAKGFGFIAPSDGGADIFVHVSAVERAGLHGLNEGQPISYDLEQDRRTGKTSAVNLRV